MSAGGSLTRKRFAEGDLIFMEGDPGDETFLIQTGKIEIIKRDATGMFEPVAVLGPGQVFGEMALATSKPRAAGARALADSEVIAVSRAQVAAKLKDADPFIAALFRILAGNLEAIVARKSKEEKRSAAKPTAQDLDALTGEE
ncbi:MAG: cyclic nucleotide-binding domain-containing protein [Marivibrio sp.]|uniref:cyclic nucleotide-binding domain-containing protein n=1 Tax=Marivibrio sp. TaxID=2039719 RepID=UPI0032EF92B1